MTSHRTVDRLFSRASAAFLWKDLATLFTGKSAFPSLSDPERPCDTIIEYFKRSESVVSSSQ